MQMAWQMIVVWVMAGTAIAAFVWHERRVASLVPAERIRRLAGAPATRAEPARTDSVRVQPVHRPRTTQENAVVARFLDELRRA